MTPAPASANLPAKPVAPARGATKTPGRSETKTPSRVPVDSEKAISNFVKAMNDRGKETDDETLAAFRAAFSETMRNVGTGEARSTDRTGMLWMVHNKVKRPDVRVGVILSYSQPVLLGNRNLLQALDVFGSKIGALLVKHRWWLVIRTDGDFCTIVPIYSHGGDGIAHLMSEVRANYVKVAKMSDRDKPNAGDYHPFLVDEGSEFQPGEHSYACLTEYVSVPYIDYLKVVGQIQNSQLYRLGELATALFRTGIKIDGLTTAEVPRRFFDRDRISASDMMGGQNFSRVHQSAPNKRGRIEEYVLICWVYTETNLNQREVERSRPGRLPDRGRQWERSSRWRRRTLWRPQRQGRRRRTQRRV